ncbi:MAG: hypothetical protein KBG84_10555 [Planctomycetes bacterium]|nr:hypothetical protein [Planctomycetota bacterium]
MKYLFLMCMPMLWLCGCGAHDDSKVIALEKRVVAAEARADEQEAARKNLEVEQANLRKTLDGWKREPAAAAQAGVTRDELKKEIDDAMEALRKELAPARPAETTSSGGTTGKVEPPREKTEAEKAKAIEEAKVKLAEKLPGFYANVGDTAARKAFMELMWEVDAKTRKEVVDKLKAMVAENPEDKTLRLTLAEALMSQWRDVKPGIEQGIWANNVLKESKKAAQIDPDYYDAVAFMATFKSNYPEGFPEFAEAPKDLDKALELQSKMAWEDRFGEIYVAYAQWYFKQQKYDEAMAKVQAGLDKDARNQELIDLKKKIEEAKK